MIIGSCTISSYWRRFWFGICFEWNGEVVFWICGFLEVFFLTPYSQMMETMWKYSIFYASNCISFLFKLNLHWIWSNWNSIEFKSNSTQCILIQFNVFQFKSIEFDLNWIWIVIIQFKFNSIPFNSNCTQCHSIFLFEWKLISTCFPSFHHP
jgi:hypothetical protein